MRSTLKFGIGLGTAAIVATMSAGVAAAATSGQQHAAGQIAAVSVNKHITRAQARQIAGAKVPHSRVIEVESDDLHDRAVWKVQLATSHGRVVVDVDKRTGQATIVRGHGGGHGDTVLASSIIGPVTSSGSLAADDHGRDAGANDGARQERGDRHDDGRGDRHDHDRGDRHGDDHGDGGSGQ